MTGSPRICILDDGFPEMVSGFRIKEYSYLLDTFRNAQTFSLARPDFEDALREYLKEFPQHEGRLNQFTSPAQLANFDLAYISFLNNGILFYDALHEQKLPFVLQLYPGGNFALNDEASDSRLRLLLNSPLLRHVITTQPIASDYLIKKFGLTPDKFTELGPGPLPNSSKIDIEAKHKSSLNKSSFDVLFFAFKYFKNLKNKGFDFFSELVPELAKRIQNLRVHVIGNYDENDAPQLKNFPDVNFHGVLKPSKFSEILTLVDVAISPNIPSALYKGNFDGFPTGAMAQAALAGAVIIVTDPLDQNRYLKPGEDILILKRDTESILPSDLTRWANTVADLASDRNRLSAIANSGARSFQNLFSDERQLLPRASVLAKAVNSPRHNIIEASKETIRDYAIFRREVEVAMGPFHKPLNLDGGPYLILQDLAFLRDEALRCQELAQNLAVKNQEERRLFEIERESHRNYSEIERENFETHRKYYETEREKLKSVNDCLANKLIKTRRHIAQLARKKAKIGTMISFARLVSPFSEFTNRQKRILVQASGFFDESWYRKQYADLQDVDDLLSHYLNHGEKEGRSPGPDFDPAWYSATYKDVADAGYQPLIHYLLWGAEEGRLPHL